MKKLSGKLIIIVFAVGQVLFQSCVKQVEPVLKEDSARNVVNLTISADRVIDGNAEDGTRISADNEGSLQWDGNESIGIIFAKDQKGDYRYVQELKTLNGHPGVFSGPVDLGEFSMDNIIGIVCPCNEQSWGRFNKETRRITMQIGTEDYIQEISGKINWNGIPFFAELSSSDFQEVEGGYVVSGKQMKCGAAIIEFKIYGKHSDGLENELITSIRLNTSNATNYPIGTAEWKIGENSFVFNHNVNNRDYLMTCLATPHIICENPEASATIYVVTLPKGDTGSMIDLNKVIISTDNAFYGKEINKKISLTSGHIQPIKMDIASFTRKLSFDETYESLTLERGGSDSNQKQFVYNYYEPLKDLPINVFYYIPTTGDITKMPILIAMHGNGRGASSLLKYWRPYAKERGVIVVVPHFAEETYSSLDYHLGGVSKSSSSYVERPYELRTYNIIEKLFDLIKDKTGNMNETYDMAGHSAGSQFTHRFLLHTPECRVGRAVSSNAGYYTFPIDDENDEIGKYGFPYSITGMNIPDEQLAKFFAREMIVHLGTADTSTSDPDLKKTEAANAQGAYRLERGHTFFDRSKAEAEKMGVPFNWKLVEVPGVGHSASGMIKAEGVGAADLLYGDNQSL